MHGNSRKVATNQKGPHPRLEELVLKHMETTNLTPIRESTASAFDRILDKIEAAQLPIILDSCCGVGTSTQQLASTHPNHLVLGIDQSAKRLSTGRTFDTLKISDNMVLLRAEVQDVWKLMLQHKIFPEKHFILYPNPWPKSIHMKRRWHGHPAFRSIVELGGRMELRSNFKLYLEEFAIALRIVDIASELTEILKPQPISTPFEQKYFESGHQLYSLVARAAPRQYEG